MSTSYSPKIVTEGLVFAADAANTKSYPGSGTAWNDLSGNNNSGSLTNGPTFNSGNNGSILFDGVDDYINLSSISLGNTFTLMAMIRLSGSNADTSIFGSDANGQDNWFGVNLDKIYLFGTQTVDVNNFNVVGTTTLNTTNTVWYHVVCTINTSTATVYVNGVQEATSTQAFTIGSWSSTAALGRRGGLSQRYFKGHIANIAAYNRVLSTQEILQNFNATRGRFGV
jgi:hypothetical protein